MKIEAAVIVLTHQTSREFMSEFKEDILRYRDYINNDYFSSLNLVVGTVPYDEGKFTKEDVAFKCKDDENRNQYLCGLLCMPQQEQAYYVRENLQNIFEQIVRPYCSNRGMGSTASNLRNIETEKIMQEGQEIEVDKYIWKDFMKKMKLMYKAKYKPDETILI